VYGRVDIVDVAGKRQLGGACAAAYGLLGFEEGDVASVSRQLYGRSEAVGARADNYRIVNPVAASPAHDFDSTVSFPMPLIRGCRRVKRSI